MKKYVFIICALSVFLTGCGDKKAEWIKGCKAGAESVAGFFGASITPESLDKGCNAVWDEEQAEKAQK